MREGCRVCPSLSDVRHAKLAPSRLESMRVVRHCCKGSLWHPLAKDAAYTVYGAAQAKRTKIWQKEQCARSALAATIIKCSFCLQTIITHPRERLSLVLAFNSRIVAITLGARCVHVPGRLQLCSALRGSPARTPHWRVSFFFHPTYVYLYLYFSMPFTLAVVVVVVGISYLLYLLLAVLQSCLLR